MIGIIREMLRQRDTARKLARAVADPDTRTVAEAAMARARAGLEADGAAAWPYAAIVGTTEVTVLIAGVEVSALGGPWRSGQDVRRWTISRAELDRQPNAPYDGCVLVLGALGDRSVWLDLWHIHRLVAVSGDRTSAAAFAAALGVQLIDLGRLAVVALNAEFAPDDAPPPAQTLAAVAGSIVTGSGVPEWGAVVFGVDLDEDALVQLTRVMADFSQVRAILVGDTIGPRLVLTIDAAHRLTAPALDLVNVDTYRLGHAVAAAPYDTRPSRPPSAFADDLRNALATLTDALDGLDGFDRADDGLDRADDVDGIGRRQARPEI